MNGSGKPIGPKSKSQGAGKITSARNGLAHYNTTHQSAVTRNVISYSFSKRSMQQASAYMPLFDNGQASSASAPINETVDPFEISEDHDRLFPDDPFHFDWPYW